MNRKPLLAAALLQAATATGLANMSAAEKINPEQSKPLPRVLLIGDSIRGGYQKGVQRLLTGGASVPGNKGKGEHTWTGLKKVDEWLGDGRWDVVPSDWCLLEPACGDSMSRSFGHVDKAGRKLTTSPPDCERDLRPLVARLGSTGAMLVPPGTTPLRDAKPDRSRARRSATTLRRWRSSPPAPSARRSRSSPGSSSPRRRELRTTRAGHDG
jgi:hypothetical protein